MPHLNREILVRNGVRITHNKTNAAKDGSHLKTLQFMNMTLSKAFLMFVNKYPDWPYCQRTFEGLKPVWVRCATSTMRSRCCCLVHVEADLLVKGLKEALKKQKLAVPFSSAGEILRRTYCMKDDTQPFHDINCILRECSRCGPSRLSLSHPVRYCFYNCKLNYILYPELLILHVVTLHCVSNYIRSFFFYYFALYGSKRIYEYYVHEY